MEVTEALVFDILDSSDDFPVDFDIAWRWVGYARKEKAFLKVENNFDKGVDYIIDATASPNGEAMKGGQNRKIVFLTVDCFKSFCMMAGTSKGKEVRRYFIDCEKRLKDIYLEIEEKKKQRVVKALVSKDHTSWKKQFEKEFFDETYRITGWKPTAKGHPSCMGRFIKSHIYGHFPEGTLEKLEEVNPRTEKGRKRKHHQHLKDLGLETLGHHKMAVMAVMRLSPDNNQEKFKANMNKALGTKIQLELAFMEDFEDIA